MKTCKINECNSTHLARGFCKSHYRKFMKFGDPLHGIFLELHNMRKTKIYEVWSHMKARCYNHKDIAYKNYGGRGIVVCDKWKFSFTAFYTDMGNLPFPKAQIDRIDNNGNYELGNCRWVTNAENSHNTRKNVVNWFTVRSIRKLYSLNKYTRKQISMIYKLNINTLSHIIYNHGWKEN